MSYIAAGDTTFERTRTVPVGPVVAWDWLTTPALRSIWDADRLDVVTPGGRQRVGVTNHCIHGPDVIVEHVVDWRPFDYYTMSYDLPGGGSMQMTTELEPGNGETTVQIRGEPLTEERLAACEQIRFVLTIVDARLEPFPSTSPASRSRGRRPRSGLRCRGAERTRTAE